MHDWRPILDLSDSGGAEISRAHSKKNHLLRMVARTTLNVYLWPSTATDINYKVSYHIIRSEEIVIPTYLYLSSCYKKKQSIMQISKNVASVWN